MESVDQFIEQLLIDKGVADLEPKVKGELMADMKQRLMDQIDKAAVMELSEEKAAELAEKIDDPAFTNEKMTEFMQASGVDLTQVAIETMLKFRNFYLGA